MFLCKLRYIEAAIIRSRRKIGKHRFGSVQGGLLIEVSTHHDDEDVERFEESGRLPEDDE